MLVLPNSVTESKFVERNRKTLDKSFKITLAKQLDAATRFATYLVAIDRISDAISCLESFVNDVDYDGNETRWGAVGQGVLLLGYLYQKTSHFDFEQRQVQRIVEEDIMSEDCNRSLYLAEDLAEHQEKMEYVATETQKYKCEIISQQILNFTYYYEMWPYLESEVHASEKEVLASVISRSYEDLRVAIST